MSDYEASENGRSEVTEFSLIKAVEEISRHGLAQIEDLREKQKTLGSLQETLSELEKKGEAVQQELRSKIREVLVQGAATEQLERQKDVLQDRCSSISKENADLRIRIAEAEEAARAALARFCSYRVKMEGHRVAVLHGARQKEAEKKRALVRKMEESEALENREGSVEEKAKRETEALKVEVSRMEKMAAERREQLLKEAGIHAGIKKDTEIQRRRWEAIARRLHLQVSRAQDEHRQVCDDVARLERELEELKQRL